MSRDDWFRRTTWTAEDRDGFFQRLQRSRGPSAKAQYLRIQAHHLAETRKSALIRAALELLELLFAEYPHPSELASAHCQAAECHRLLGETDAAIHEYRLALRAEAEFPNVRTSAPIEFPWWVATERMTQLYDEALRALDSALLDSSFPIERFRAYGARAFIAEARGDRALAAQHAAAALAAADLRESGYRYHRWLGLVGSRDDRLVHRLRKLAATPLNR